MNMDVRLYQETLDLLYDQTEEAKSETRTVE